MFQRTKKVFTKLIFLISDNLSWSEFSKLNLFLHEVQGIKPIVSVAREYVEDGSFSHVIGYVSEISVKDLENVALDYGQAAFRGRQIYNWIYNLSLIHI